MKKLLAVLALLVAYGGFVVGASVRSTPKIVEKTVSRPVSRAVPIYITNLAPHYWSEKAIRADIPAWEQALNVDFARYWYSTQYKLIYLGDKPAPKGQISAIIQSKGPIQGALAYHWIERNGAPSITVYAGTGDYYGYDNSISMTHELFELAADPLTSYASEGYPSAFYWLEKPNLTLEPYLQTNIIAWFNEVADPVEADFYKIGKVKISDFVTPAWFNDGVGGGRFDFMGLCQQPFWVRPGGYAQFEDALGWHQVLNFRKGVVTDGGFYKADPDGARGRLR